MIQALVRMEGRISGRCRLLQGPGRAHGGVHVRFQGQRLGRRGRVPAGQPGIVEELVLCVSPDIGEVAGAGGLAGVELLDE